MRMKPGRKDAFGNTSSGGTGLGGPPDHPLRRPFRIDLMRLWHVFFDGGMPAYKKAPGVRSYTMSFMETLDSFGRQANIYLSSIKLIRYTVIMSIDFHMIIDVDSGLLPLGVDIPLGG